LQVLITPFVPLFSSFLSLGANIPLGTLFLYIEKHCTFFPGTEKLVNTDSSQSNIKNISTFLQRTWKD